MEWAEQKRGDLDARDILSIIVNNPDAYGAPPSRNIIGGLLSFTFGAAYETCQNALVWTLILLAHHREIAANVRDEISEAVGGDIPTMEQIGDLPLLDGVVKEGMRLFPPVPVQFRRSLKDTVVGDFSIRAGTRVLASAFLINRNPDMYPEPDRFLPERWSRLDPSPYEYTVYGAGNRMCPGFMFGNQMVKISLAAILTRHRFEMMPGARIDHRTSITLSPHPAVPMILRDTAGEPAINRVRGRIHELVEIPGSA
ncbi:MAG: cytochrome P450 [Alphaproteobacteria bacterium]